MAKGKELADDSMKYLGVPYSEMDCQKFIEKVLSDCGIKKDLPGSNSWYREIMKNGWVGTPEECKAQHGEIPAGAFLFIRRDVTANTPVKFRDDGIGDISHMGLVTWIGEGAIHSSESRDMVCESKFKGKTIPNGGWNRIGLWDRVDYGLKKEEDKPDTGGDFGFPENPTWHPTIRRGSKGDDVILMQKYLDRLGYDLGPDGVDGDYGRNTEKAVREFQSDRKLVADGVCGPMTWDALERAAASQNTETDRKTYTVIIHGLDRTQANALRGSYPGCDVTEESDGNGYE